MRTSGMLSDTCLIGKKRIPTVGQGGASSNHTKKKKHVYPFLS
jgi:hypothetical protein